MENDFGYGEPTSGIHVMRISFATENYGLAIAGSEKNNAVSIGNRHRQIYDVLVLEGHGARGATAEPMRPQVLASG